MKKISFLFISIAFSYIGNAQIPTCPSRIRLKTEAEIDKELMTVYNRSKESIAEDKKDLGKFYTYYYSNKPAIGMDTETVKFCLGKADRVIEKIENDALIQVWTYDYANRGGVCIDVKMLFFKDDKLTKIVLR